MKYLKRFNEDISKYIDNSDSYTEITSKLFKSGTPLVSMLGKEVKLSTGEVKYINKICDETKVKYNKDLYNIYKSIFSEGELELIYHIDGEKLELTIKKHENSWFYINASKKIGYKDFLCNELEGVGEFLIDLFVNKKYPSLYRSKNISESAIVDDYMSGHEGSYI